MRNKIFTLTILVLILTGLNVNAKNVNVTIPDYNFIMNNSSVYYQDSEYPLISYKNITYFPMTYEYSKCLNLTANWDNDKGLYISFAPTGYLDPPIYKTMQNNKENTAILPDYPIYINGTKIDNLNEEYPILNFRDITYFPLTWDFSYNDFLWKTLWKDNTFSIDSHSGFECSKYFDIISINDEDAILRRYVNSEFQNEKGETEYTTYQNLLKYNFKTEKSEEVADTGENPSYINESIADVTINNGQIMYKNYALCDIEKIKSGEIQQEATEIYAAKTVYNGIEVYNFIVYYNLEIPAPYTPHDIYNFAYLNGKFIKLTDNAYITNACKSGDKVYFNLKKYTGWKSSTYVNYCLLSVDENGNIENINERFSDYHSIKLLGNAQSKIYLLCTWYREDNAYPNDYGISDISQINDGFFLFDGENLTKVHNYIYTLNEFVSPSGNLYATTPFKDEIIKLN